MRWRRSPREIAVRLNQEVQNLALLLRRPRLPAGEGTTPIGLPEPDFVTSSLRGTRAALMIVTTAEQVLAHRFPLLGLEIDTGPEIRWRRDYQSGRETPAVYFRRIPYLNAERAGDHKIIWELNRHQHLVLLAQAHLLTARAEFLDEIGRELESWWEANPFQCGINWASALEVAFRALSWIWIDHLVGGRMEPALRLRLREELYRHGLHIANNLSFYFSPNTHLLGEAVALHALGILFRGTAGTGKWERVGAQVISEQLDRQVRADGSHFEQSSYYHVYALDMFLFHAVLAPPPESYRAKLARMAEYLDALLGPSRTLPFIGDDDGGRFFNPYGPRDRFGRATLVTCGVLLGPPEWIAGEDDLHAQAIWWLGPQEFNQAAIRSERSSRWFPGAGTAVMVSGGVHVVADAGPFGPFRSGHSHADTLSIVARSGEQELLIDPGTFTYVGDPRWRDMFRGTAAHNTIRLQGLDQADAAGPFAWLNPPQVEMKQWCSGSAADFLDAACRYRGYSHRRRLFFVKPELLFILDDVECDGSIEAEQYWHPAGPVEKLAPGCFGIAGAGMLTVAADSAGLIETGELAWRSPVFGVKEPSPVLVVRQSGTRALQFGAVLRFGAPSTGCSLALAAGKEDVAFLLTGGLEARVAFPERGMPRQLPPGGRG